MMHQVYKTLPDDRPIMSIHVIEDPDKCPTGFVVVSRTHDQDSDADLWREGSFFGKKCTRYICLSKTEGITDYIIESVAIINEKEVPPDGYALITRTADTDQRAWRKRQLCYRLARRNQAASAVTDIIVMGRLKKAPNGFSLAGEINGMTVCFKCGPSLAPVNKPSATQPSQLLYSLSPAPTYLPHFNSPQPYSAAAVVNKAPINGEAGGESPHEYEQLVSLQPSRPAPKPPGASTHGTYATIAAYSGLDGVPFILNPSLQNLSHRHTHQIPVIKSKTKHELNKEYDYDFRVERET
ncbi:multivesicular body subunit 12A isoform X1 [Cryptotermes secundus]|uniref:multivesicular body subunit 12A isoform X1 n=1 Tax=Cryptotermes secundus TaxID=105785 RepID=UPI000CD7DCEA|nr:multivesicular body subunit 12A isoform X1 [Cryptotermes secundus]XP_023707622.1 multivesicular body subunit 12A isoform X1 [Cryptotermes secundus]XP_023707623.1 multivesicular body subunit 12A isoform X1 [Cryptotermes secundus]XP_023707624.1 multivesicular body subunit 12A isoform X1 [Cryptotermes secundus]XP_023707625.1 multivesicular body subunit 12A isoform X1 [Cryptotermes secundus]XP_033607365.1 multivesicular body subunit 12A isoform X1 [Cryptotermes secundus]XP_033607366.1 multives